MDRELVSKRLFIPVGKVRVFMDSAQLRRTLFRKAPLAPSIESTEAPPGRQGFRLPTIATMKGLTLHWRNSFKLFSIQYSPFMTIYKSQLGQFVNENLLQTIPCVIGSCTKRQR